MLAQFPQAEVIDIDHYKDVFCRSRQDYVRQHAAQNLILAAKHGELLYPGAPVCQNFGNEHFYYTSCVMNCVFDCEYCYLKGMYPSANLVVFVNLEDIFAEVEKRLDAHPVYLCVSYDTDLLALEHLTGYAARWIEFVRRMNTGGQRNVTKLAPSEKVKIGTRTAHSATEQRLCAVFLKKGMTRKRIEKSAKKSYSKRINYATL